MLLSLVPDRHPQGFVCTVVSANVGSPRGLGGVCIPEVALSMESFSGWNWESAPGVASSLQDTPTTARGPGPHI